MWLRLTTTKIEFHFFDNFNRQKYADYEFHVRFLIFKMAFVTQGGGWGFSKSLIWNPMTIFQNSK